MQQIVVNFHNFSDVALLLCTFSFFGSSSVVICSFCRTPATSKSLSFTRPSSARISNLRMIFREKLFQPEDAKGKFMSFWVDGNLGEHNGYQLTKFCTGLN